MLLKRNTCSKNWGTTLHWSYVVPPPKSHVCLLLSTVFHANPLDLGPPGRFLAGLAQTFDPTLLPHLQDLRSDFRAKSSQHDSSGYHNTSYRKINYIKEGLTKLCSGKGTFPTVGFPAPVVLQRSGPILPKGDPDQARVAPGYGYDVYE